MKRTQMKIINTCFTTTLVALAFTISASAQTVGGGTFAEGGHNADQPIEISSDTLELEQEKQIAVFAGSVDAVQGDMSLKTDRLEVHYTTDEEAGVDGESQSISSMEAIGNVYVNSPRETAQGDTADYNVIDRILTLNDNVLLTQGSNVLCGNTLDMYLDTGRSLLKGACKKSSTNKKGRVQGVFFPSNSKD
jgi:lipopolysaccharide export system protein LptA